MKSILTPLLLICLCATAMAAKPIKVFVLAGDECVLENAPLAAKDRKGQPLPGTLESVVAGEPRYGFLKDKQGTKTSTMPWRSR